MKSIVSSLFLFAMILPAAAASERGTASQRAACTPDVFRLCASEIPSVDGILSCLRREKAHLSSGCRVVITGGEHQVVTRSLAPANAKWCDFEGVADAADHDWRAWCDAAARPDSKPQAQ